MNKPLTSIPTVYPAEIAEKGITIYKKLSGRLEKKHFGEFVAIEVETGKYFVGKTQMEATTEAKKEFPQEIFYLMKVGFPAVVTFSGYQRPLSYGNIL